MAGRDDEAIYARVSVDGDMVARALGKSIRENSMLPPHRHDVEALNSEPESEPVYRYIKHDYGFRKVRIDGVTSCQIEQDGRERWVLMLLRGGARNIFNASSDQSDIAGFFPTLEAAQRVMEKIWAALELDALVIE